MRVRYRKIVRRDFSFLCENRGGVNNVIWLLFSLEFRILSNLHMSRVTVKIVGYHLSQENRRKIANGMVRNGEYALPKKGCNCRLSAVPLERLRISTRCV